MHACALLSFYNFISAHALLAHGCAHAHAHARAHAHVHAHVHARARAHGQAGTCFALARPQEEFVFLRDIFLATEGVFTIRCTHYDEEDIELHGTSQVEGIEHYVVYNADTR